jgi:hypothetical protein
MQQTQSTVSSEMKYAPPCSATHEAVGASRVAHVEVHKGRLVFELPAGNASDKLEASDWCYFYCDPETCDIGGACQCTCDPVCTCG